jgi:hypothetical protein
MEAATPEGAEITVNLGDPELVHALYVAAAGLDTSADAIVAEAVREWLANQEQRKGRATVPPKSARNSPE